MIRAPLRPSRLLLTALVLAALPLLAATCGSSSTGARAFARNSLIIPMDACYQGDGQTVPTACPGAADPGNVLRAYGLVYQLLQNNIPVYWIIQPNKSAFTAVDLTVNWSGGSPAAKYEWASGSFNAPPPNNATHQVNYRGGPFVVDGAYFSQANALLQSSTIKSTFGTTSPVNVHVSNVAFTANVTRAMNGGWNAGGNTPPPIALLNITGADGQNSVGVLQDYLDAAGLGALPGAGGTATGPHGTIYDKLDVADFLPDLANSRLGKNGYRVLWAPHWVGTRATNPLQVSYNQAELDAVRATIHAFVTSGRDFFAQCSAITTIEGGKEWCAGINNDDTTATARFMTTNGIDYNVAGYTNAGCGVGITPLTFKSFGSPFMQVADFAFAPDTGAVASYRPSYNKLSSNWQPGVSRLISSGAFPQWDLFTLKGGSGGSGNVLYLAGHDFKGKVAGNRLVLNTLFNLGSSCVSANTPCDTGQLGVCGQGMIQCVNELPTCVPVGSAAAETCDGLDNDCNGLVDDGVTRSCYGGASGTLGVGTCTGGVQTCVAGAWAACAGEVLATAEICNALDDDCDGAVDEGVTQPCYEGPVGSAGTGTCHAGTQACSAGTWGACSGQVLPAVETCGDGVDDNCDGQVDEGCGCPNGASQPCYGGATGTAGVGPCKPGLQLCTAGQWGACTGQVLPATEACNGLDDDCDGQVNEGGVCDVCSLGQGRDCYVGPAGTEGRGMCRPGTQACDGGQWDSCVAQVLPAPELCNGLDDDCDGAVDNDPLCPAFHACVGGLCVPDPCSSEFALCPEGFTCNANHACVPTGCGGGAPCPVGQGCKGGACVDPCAGVTCGAGAVCAGGLCTGGGCYATGCPTGQLCVQGACVLDACAALTCPSGTLCRAGDCVQSCAFRQCTEGQSCTRDGFCAPDACAEVSCGPGQSCDGGTCAADPCDGVGCGPRQACAGGRCVDDPCNGVTCPVGTCVAGQCYGGLKPDAGTDGGVDAGDPGEAPDAGWPSSQDAGNWVPDAGSVPAADAGSDTPGSIRAGTSSCGCTSAAPGAWAPLAWLLGLALGRRRTRRAQPRIPAAGTHWGAPLLGLLVLACGGVRRPVTTEVPTCSETRPCATGLTCEDGLCVAEAAPDAGQPVGVQPDGGTDDAGHGPSCVTCGGPTCVDLQKDPVHCGTCARACSGGELCVDGECGPSGAVAPWIASASPTQLPQGSKGTVLLTGERFAAGAAVRVLGSSGPLPATASVATASSLTATLDLSHAAPGLLELRVVNPDHVVSNAVSLQVTAAVPFISKISPDLGVTGGTIILQVTGSGFLPDPGSRCKVSGPGVSSLGLPTHGLGPAELECTLDLSTFQPGSYTLVVTNDGLSFSNSVPFTVISATPVISTVAPGSGRPGAKMSLFVHGSGFDATSVVHFSGQPLPTTWVSHTDLVASPLDLAQVSPGSYPVQVINGGTLASNTASFTVDPNPPALTSLSPPSALQGQVVTLQLGGTDFLPGSVVHAYDLGGTDTALPTTVVSSTQLEATFDLTQLAAGNYRVAVVTGAALSSNTLAFQVLSNVATLLGLSPAGGAQGTSVSLSLSGTNILPGAVAWISGNGLAPTALNTTVTSTSAAQVQNLSLAGWRTGTYVVNLVNPGAAPSNQVGFTVFAGAPALNGLAPTTAALGTMVTVTLTGENFAHPDGSGAGGSTVHARCETCGVLDSVLPATVVSPSLIQVTFDTGNAPPGTYEVTVWNPGGTPPPQKSAAQPFTLTP